MRPPAWDHCGGEHYRRSGLGRAALRGGSGMGAIGARDCSPHSEYAVPGDRNLAHRIAQVYHARLPPFRRPARGVAHPALLERFYQELINTQQVLNKKHLGLTALRDTFFLAAKYLAQGQTNFVKMLWRFNKVYNLERQLRDHQQKVRYEIELPHTAPQKRVDPSTLFIHPQSLLRPMDQSDPAVQHTIDH